MTTELKPVRFQGITIPLYRYKDGRTAFADTATGTRKMRPFRSEQKARDEAEKFAMKLLNGDVVRNAFKAADLTELAHVKQILQPLNVGLSLAIEEYAAARAICGGRPLLEVLRVGADKLTIVRKTVAEAMTEFLAAKVAQRRSEAYCEQLDKDIGRFRDAFASRQLIEITTVEIESYLDTCGQWRREMKGKKPCDRKFVACGPKRRNQIRGSIATAFSFAKSRGYLAKNEPTAADSVLTMGATTGKCAVYSPKQIRAFLEATATHSPAYLPWMAIGAFSGMRTGAILRLDWSDIHWDSNVIEVEARNSKVGKRYLAPLHDVLKAWLTPYRRDFGPVAPANPLSRLTSKLGTWTCIKWQKNALRASYISYRFAQTGNDSMVAGECNTSAAEVRRDYRDVRTLTRDLVTADLAASYFGIMPPSATNVVQGDFRFA